MTLVKKNSLVAVCCVLAAVTAAPAGAVCFVDGTASGLDDGRSWANAYVDLNSALNDVVCNEIWVAKGVYVPSTTDRNVSFQIRPGVAVYGGFSGYEITRESRSSDPRKTIISGDIDRNDANAGASDIDDAPDDISGDNSYVVVRLDGTMGTIIDGDTIVDGFTITGGLANGSDPSTSNGAGLNCNGQGTGSACSPVLRNILFSGNQATNDGGALYNDAFNDGESNPVLDNVTFKGNDANHGGAIYNNGSFGGASGPTILTSNFVANTAFQGGAIYSDGEYLGNSNASFLHSVFRGNSAVDCGGAIALSAVTSGSAGVSIAGSLFQQNMAAIGGAICKYAEEANSFVTVSNSTFYLNEAQLEGGAIYDFKYSASGFGAVETVINNSTFTENHATGDGVTDGQGGGLFIDSEVGTDNTARLVIRNSILWKDVASDDLVDPEVTVGTADVKMEFSDVEGGCVAGASCAHVMNSDPELSALGSYFGLTPTLRPSTGSPVIDNGDDVTCESLDQRGIARPQRAHCDMGSVELRFPSDDIEYPTGF
jgi:predicted outer membrane repeat protein